MWGEEATAKMLSFARLLSLSLQIIATVFKPRQKRAVENPDCAHLGLPIYYRHPGFHIKFLVNIRYLQR